MTKVSLLWAFAASLIVTPGVVQADTILFNDLSTPNRVNGGANWGLVSTSYDNLTWTGWEVVNGQQFNGVYGGSVFHGPYPNNAAYNGGTGNLTVTISSGRQFDLYSADFSYWPGIGNIASQTVTITGYRNNVQVAPAEKVTLTSGFRPTAIDLSRVDKVTFTASAANRYWLMDNLQTTPEPAPMVLIGAGLACLVLRCRKQAGRY